MKFIRYAVYFTPDVSGGLFGTSFPFSPLEMMRYQDLAKFGSQWLGWDCVAGVSVTPPEFSDLLVSEITSRPRRYGFHATIMAPFHLTAQFDQQDLEKGFETVCAQNTAPVFEGLTLARLGRFLALIPVGNTAPIGALEHAVLNDLNRFRAPLSTSDFARRLPARADARQRELVKQFGAANVLERYHFHMTMTAPINPKKRERAQHHLEEILPPLLPSPFVIHSLSLMGEDANGQFHLIDQKALIHTT